MARTGKSEERAGGAGRRPWRLQLGAIGLAASLVGCGGRQPAPEPSGEPGGGGAAGAARRTIAVIPKGTTHEFWKSVHAGAVKASRELGVEIIWKGPQIEDDRAAQITVVEDFITRRVDGIVLAPLDETALVRPVREAKQRGIPTVIIDSGLAGSDFASFVATDNYRGGVLAAQRLGELLGGAGRIFLIRYQEGSASTMQRESGFRDTMEKEFAQIVFLVDDQYAGATTDTAYELAENLLNRYPDVDGIFCPNESSTFGTLLALQAAGLAGKVKFVGFDSSEKLVRGMRDGQIHGLVLQNPSKMGYLGVKTMVEHLAGTAVEARIDTGVMLVTPENMAEPDVAQLLSPDLTEWLE